MITPISVAFEQAEDIGSNPTSNPQLGDVVC